MLINAFVIYVLQRQEAIDDTSRLLYKFSSYIRIILSLSLSSWCIGWYWYGNDEKSCLIVYAMFFFLTYSSLFVHMLCYSFTSICKLILITRPLRHHIILTSLKVKIVLLFIMLVSILICIPLLPWSNYLSNCFASLCQTHVSHRNDVVSTGSGLAST